MYKCRIERQPTMIQYMSKVWLYLSYTPSNMQSSIELTVFLTGLGETFFKQDKHGTFRGGCLWPRPGLPNVARAKTNRQTNELNVDILKAAEGTCIKLTATHAYGSTVNLE